ncbi:YrhK family protein [Pseudonocardia spirodelae]|uniref:YrhK family protein n=1 Tax=Pseudonocardia spirodelae TaxID=3133431 RepID=A0ABU8T7S0_9PSEU
MGPTAPLTFTIGHEELVVRRRYEVLSIVNDILVALWFVVGSVLFFSESTTYAGTWLFLVGSVELMVRPVIRLTRRVHLRRISGRPPEADHDF